MKKFMTTLLLGSMTILCAADAAPRPSLVVTAPVSKGIVNPLQTYVGTLYYDKQSRLASEFEGVAGRIMFEEGEHVPKGHILMQLDSRVLKANIEAAASSLKALEASLMRQERDLERSKALLERQSISQSSYDQIFYGTETLRAQTDAARNQLLAMQIQLEKYSVRAPYDAVVTAQGVEVGEWVGKGTTVATLVAPKSLEARLNIPARLINAVRSAKRFHASVEGRELDVTLKSTVPVADAATRTFPVTMNVPGDMGLIEGMRIDIQVPTLQEAESLMVPRDAVIKRFGQTVVFAAVDGKAVMIPVEVIGYKTDLAAIRGEGIVEKMHIVVKGNERIFPNMPVTEKE